MDYFINTNGVTSAVITKANQVITWNNPSDIVYEADLGATQLITSVVGVSGSSSPSALTYSSALGVFKL